MSDRKFEILDCTLRDGGYYTNWDFDDSTVDTYLKSCENLPIDYLEVGYRSPQKTEYFGKYFYCPKYVLEGLKKKTSKHMAILLNEKDIKIESLDEVLDDCSGLVDLVRVAVNPANMNRAIELARAIKSRGYHVAFNVMYMSTWSEIDGFYEQISRTDGLVDYFYLVDSYGGVSPEEVRTTIQKVRSKTGAKIGFHGHNNLELGLINTLAAVEAGADIVDATITGMGRGAGNLKMELLLTYLASMGAYNVDFNALGSIVGEFEKLKTIYNWGTNLPYMVSGANSLPQKDVMEWVGKRYYSMNSIIQALNNQSAGLEDNVRLEPYQSSKAYDAVLIIGGGPSIKEHATALNQWINKQSSICVIHASSKNSLYFKKLEISQTFCLVGNEGYRLEENTQGDFGFVSECILPPYPRKMGTYIPEELAAKSYELMKITFTDKVKDSHTVLALQSVIEMKAKNVFIAGYDGYLGNNVSQIELELSMENEVLFRDFQDAYSQITSLTPTKYESVQEVSIYSAI